VPQFANCGGGLYFGKAKMYEINLSLQNFVYFVCFASQNAILSQPSADSPFQKGPFLRLPVNFPLIRAAGEVIQGDIENISDFD
jgi:hypothetical protein